MKMKKRLFCAIFVAVVTLKICVALEEENLYIDMDDQPVLPSQTTISRRLGLNMRSSLQGNPYLRRRLNLPSRSGRVMKTLLTDNPIAKRLKSNSDMNRKTSITAQTSLRVNPLQQYRQTYSLPQNPSLNPIRFDPRTARRGHQNGGTQQMFLGPLRYPGKDMTEGLHVQQITARRPNLMSPVLQRPQDPNLMSPVLQRPQDPRQAPMIAAASNFKEYHHVNGRNHAVHLQQALAMLKQQSQQQTRRPSIAMVTEPGTVARNYLRQLSAQQLQSRQPLRMHPTALLNEKHKDLRNLNGIKPEMSPTLNNFEAELLKRLLLREQGQIKHLPLDIMPQSLKSISEKQSQKFVQAIKVPERSKISTNSPIVFPEDPIREENVIFPEGKSSNLSSTNERVIFRKELTPFSSATERSVTVLNNNPQGKGFIASANGNVTPNRPRKVVIINPSPDVIKALAQNNNGKRKITALKAPFMSNKAPRVIFESSPSVPKHSMNENYLKANPLTQNQASSQVRPHIQNPGLIQSYDLNQLAENLQRQRLQKIKQLNPMLGSNVNLNAIPISQLKQNLINYHSSRSPTLNLNVAPTASTDINNMKSGMLNNSMIRQLSAVPMHHRNRQHLKQNRPMSINQQNVVSQQNPYFNPMMQHSHLLNPRMSHILSNQHLKAFQPLGHHLPNERNRNIGFNQPLNIPPALLDLHARQNANIQQVVLNNQFGPPLHHGIQNMRHPNIRVIQNSKPILASLMNPNLQNVKQVVSISKTIPYSKLMNTESSTENPLTTTNPSNESGTDGYELTTSESTTTDSFTTSPVDEFESTTHSLDSNIEIGENKELISQLNDYFQPSVVVPTRNTGYQEGSKISTLEGQLKSINRPNAVTPSVKYFGTQDVKELYPSTQFKFTRVPHVVNEKHSHDTSLVTQPIFTRVPHVVNEKHSHNTSPVAQPIFTRVPHVVNEKHPHDTSPITQPIFTRVPHVVNEKHFHDTSSQPMLTLRPVIKPSPKYFGLNNNRSVISEPKFRDIKKIAPVPQSNGRWPENAFSKPNMVFTMKPSFYPYNISNLYAVTPSSISLVKNEDPPQSNGYNVRHNNPSNDWTHSTKPATTSSTNNNLSFGSKLNPKVKQVAMAHMKWNWRNASNITPNINAIDLTDKLALTSTVKPSTIYDSDSISKPQKYSRPHSYEAVRPHLRNNTDYNHYLKRITPLVKQYAKPPIYVNPTTKARQNYHTTSTVSDDDVVAKLQYATEETTTRNVMTTYSDFELSEIESQVESTSDTTERSIDDANKNEDYEASETEPNLSDTITWKHFRGPQSYVWLRGGKPIMNNWNSVEDDDTFLESTTEVPSTTISMMPTTTISRMPSITKMSSTTVTRIPSITKMSPTTVTRIPSTTLSMISSTSTMVTPPTSAEVTTQDETESTQQEILLPRTKVFTALANKVFGRRNFTIGRFTTAATPAIPRITNPKPKFSYAPRTDGTTRNAIVWPTKGSSPKRVFNFRTGMTDLTIGELNTSGTNDVHSKYVIENRIEDKTLIDLDPIKTTSQPKAVTSEFDVSRIVTIGEHSLMNKTNDASDVTKYAEVGKGSVVRKVSLRGTGPSVYSQDDKSTSKMTSTTIPTMKHTSKLPESTKISTISNSTDKTMIVESTTSLSTEMNQELVMVESLKAMKSKMQGMMSKGMRHLMPMFMGVGTDVMISSDCTFSLLRLLRGVRMMEQWAVKMVDASSKIPEGILYGTFSTFGSYDECIGIKTPDSSLQTPFTGQYCSINIQPLLPQKERHFTIHGAFQKYPKLKQIFKEMNIDEDTMAYYYLLKHRLGLCVPSTCTIEDLHNVTYKLVDELKMSVTVGHCETATKPKFTKGQIISMSAILGIFAIVVLATLIDMGVQLTSKYEMEVGKIVNKKNKLGRFSFAFSAYGNACRILNTSLPSDHIACLHGIKFLSITWIMLGHVYYCKDYLTLAGLNKVRDLGSNLAFQVVLNSAFGADTFFFISGLLVVYTTFQYLEKTNNGFNIVGFYTRRYFRLTPAFLMVSGIILLGPLAGSGPIWNETLKPFVSGCQNYWWTNFFYFSNFMPTAKTCIPHGWFLSCDMQFYIVSPIIILSLYRCPRMGMLLIILGIILSMSATGLLTYLNNLPPVSLFSLPAPKDINEFLDTLGYKPYAHYAPYCIGMATGFLLAVKQKISLSKVLQVVGWVISTVICLLVVYGTWNWNSGHLPDWTISVAYATTSRTAWSLGVAWLTIVCCSGKGGIVNDLLSWRGFIPLSRLTYLSYLIHPLLMYLYASYVRSPFYFSQYVVVYLYLGHLCVTFGLAFILSLAFELPFLNLEKIVARQFHQPRRRHTSSNISHCQHHWSQPEMKDSVILMRRRVDLYNSY